MTKWRDLLQSCDLIMARDEIAAMHRMTQAEAVKQGGSYYYKEEYVRTWEEFRASPTAQNAAALLNEAPMLATYFEECSPGGSMFKLNDRLRDGDRGTP